MTRPTQPSDPPRTAPTRTFVDGQPAPWPTAVWHLWQRAVAPRFTAGQSCVTANWSRGLPVAGTPRSPQFVYVVAPGDLVAYHVVARETAAAAGAL